MLPFDLLMDDDGKAFPENVDINPKEDVLVLPYSSGTTGLIDINDNVLNFLNNYSNMTCCFGFVNKRV
jgi:protein involved in ribonucleotide reduction